MISSRTHEGVVPDKGYGGSINKSLARIPRFLKLVRRLAYQFLAHCLDAGYDLLRYMRYSNSFLRSTQDRQRLESLLFFYYHKMEKSLCLPEVKPVFGLGYLETLLDLIEQWNNLTGDTNAVVFRGACETLACYQDHVGSSLSQIHPDLARRIEDILVLYKNSEGTLGPGGTTLLTLNDLQPVCSVIDFNRFVHQRHSVRNFSEQHISDQDICQAVETAQQSPSVCNRQCCRVHVFTTNSDKAMVLQCQNGNEGFGHLADRVVLITAELRSFISSGERNQAYIDAGMFTMTLLYAFQVRGIMTCCLNVSHSRSADLALRKATKIPPSEIPVVMIALGYPPESLRVAKSARVPSDAILSFRN